MASIRGVAETADGYTRFNDDINNSHLYGTNNTMEISDTIALGQSGRIPDQHHVSDEIGSRSSLNRDNFDPSRVGGDGVDHHWEMNYHEAAIFLSEGENNEKFDSHPKEPEALPAYLLVHNPWYYGLDIATSILLMVLAFGEDPAVPSLKLSVGVHGTIELLALTIIAIEVAFKLRWIGWKTILKHKRTMIKCITLTIMFVEAIVVLVRQTSHFRVTRALRPIFLADTKACGGVRRFIRQLLQSLPPIMDMFGMLLFVIGVYSLLGYFLFQDNANPYFDTLSNSFVSLFVLMTTANFPDVMMPSYAKSKWNCIFFISFITTVLYVLMNLMLAVVYEAFTRIERDKFRKLLLHKRKACQLAFRMLVSKQTPHHMRFKQFQGLMRHYRPRKGVRDVVLMFKYLNKSGTGVLSMNEFLKIYDATTLKWIAYNPSQLWFDYLPQPYRMICSAAHTVILWPYFENIIYTLIVGNGLAMLIRLTEPTTSLQESAIIFCGSWDTILFVSLFTIEAIIRMCGLGLRQYLASGWNLYDLIVTNIAILCIITIRLDPNLTFCVIGRPLRLLRLYKIKKLYRNVFGTLVLLFPMLCSVFLVMLVAYYFFAIIGMELFAGYDMRNCCVNSTVEEFYKFNENASTPLGYYYLNNFNNMINSGVTLFELAVVNNWFITMNAYTIVAGPWSRLFFMLFYLCMLVVLTIVVASVLEAFRFQIQYKRHTTKIEEERMLHEEVEISWDDIQTVIQDFSVFEKIRSDLVPGTTTTFVGRRSRTKNVLQQHMYSSEIQNWLAEAEKNDQLETHVERDPEHLRLDGENDAVEGLLPSRLL